MHHKRHQSWMTSEEDHKPKLEWVNPCGGDFSAADTHFEFTTPRHRNPKALKPLREAIPNFIIRLNSTNMNAIDTSDISEWFLTHNSTYRFLPRINSSIAGVNLRKWHSEIQTYVGAFQYLVHKQRKFERKRNERKTKSIELGSFMVLAKNLLCEVETAINNTRQKMPVVLTRKAMDQQLTFRNNNIGRLDKEIDHVDNKFTKVRFIEYIHSLRDVMKKPRKNSLKQLKNQKRHREQKRAVSKQANATRKHLKRRNNLRKSLRKLPNPS